MHVGGPVKRKGYLRWVICWINFVRIATNSENPPLKHGQIHTQKWIPPLRGLFTFQQEPFWEIDVMQNVNFALSSNSKDQLRDLYDYSNQKVITAINILDGSTVGDNLITSHQVDYMSLALIPAEAVENEQEHLCLRNHSYIWIQYFVKILSLISLYKRTSIWLHSFDLVSSCTTEK